MGSKIQDVTELGSINPTDAIPVQAQASVSATKLLLSKLKSWIFNNLINISNANKALRINASGTDIEVFDSSDIEYIRNSATKVTVGTLPQGTILNPTTTTIKGVLDKILFGFLSPVFEDVLIGTLNIADGFAIVGETAIIDPNIKSQYYYEKGLNSINIIAKWETDDREGVNITRRIANDVNATVSGSLLVENNNYPINALNVSVLANRKLKFEIEYDDTLGNTNLLVTSKFVQLVPADVIYYGALENVPTNGTNLDLSLDSDFFKLPSGSRTNQFEFDSDSLTKKLVYIYPVALEGALPLIKIKDQNDIEETVVIDPNVSGDWIRYTRNIVNLGNPGGTPYYVLIKQQSVIVTNFTFKFE